MNTDERRDFPSRSARVRVPSSACPGGPCGPGNRCCQADSADGGGTPGDLDGLGSESSPYHPCHIAASTREACRGCERLAEEVL